MDERREAEKIVLQLREAAKTDMNIATSLRTEAPASSMFWFKMAELMEEAAKTLESRMPVEEELEGGGSTWWYVCGDCHGAIDSSDRFCRHCGRPLINQTIKQIMQNLYKCPNCGTWVSAENVVRCKDCKWNSGKPNIPYCQIRSEPHRNDWFCADGERKEGR